MTAMHDYRSSCFESLRDREISRITVGNYLTETRRIRDEGNGSRENNGGGKEGKEEEEKEVACEYVFTCTVLAELHFKMFLLSCPMLLFPPSVRDGRLREIKDRPVKDVTIFIWFTITAFHQAFDVGGERRMRAGLDALELVVVIRVEETHDGVRRPRTRALRKRMSDCVTDVKDVSHRLGFSSIFSADRHHA